MNRPLFPEIVVNGEVIPPSAIAAEAQMHPAPKGKPGLAWSAAARALAIRTLLLQEARARRIEAEPRDLGAGRVETSEEALIRGLLESAVTAAAPSEAEIRAEWARDPSRFRSPPLWEVSHILCAAAPSDETESAAARSRAEALAREVRADPPRFASVAARESDCGSRANGGALGQLSPGDSVPEFEAALRNLAEGEITAEPVQSRHGWHVIRMDAVAPGQVLPFETARPRIAAAMEKAAWARAAQDFVGSLVASAEISGVDLGAPQRASP